MEGGYDSIPLFLRSILCLDLPTRRGKLSARPSKRCHKLPAKHVAPVGKHASACYTAPVQSLLAFESG
jgi:hypothetical protein